MEKSTGKIITKKWVELLLGNPLAGDRKWTVQGLGMLRTYVPGKNRRLHVWNGSLRVPNVSKVHTHPWNFDSLIVAGELRDHSFVETSGQGALYTRQKLHCGTGGGLVGDPMQTYLKPKLVDVFTTGDEYRQYYDVPHWTEAEDGTVTLVEREVVGNPDHAFVYWQSGDWVSAEPRPATQEEILAVCANSLERWFK